MVGKQSAKLIANVVTDIFCRLDFNRIITELQSSHISPFYSTSKKAIILRGTRSADMEKGKKLLQNLIDRVKHQDPPNLKREVSIRTALRKQFNREVPASKPVKISAINSAGEADALVTWRDYVFLQLPKAIESLTIGEEYYALLVLQEDSNGIFVPVIQFRSSNGQSEGVRQIIQENIESICQRYGRHIIPIKFSQGTRRQRSGGKQRVITYGCVEQHHGNGQQLAI